MNSWKTLRGKSRFIGTGVSLAAIFLAGCSSTRPPESVEKTLPAVDQTPAQKIETHLETKEFSKPARKTSGLPFTVDSYLGRIPGLKARESLGEFNTSQKFSTDFVDGSGTITGEYSKLGRKLQHLMITGTGATFEKAVQQAVLLSIKDSTSETSKELLERLSSNDLSGYSTNLDSLKFSFAKIGNQPVFSLINENDPQKSQEQLRQDYITPTVGTGLDAFKKAFNARMSKLNPKLRIKGPGEETTTPTYFEYMFTPETVLHVYTNDKMKIENIELDSDPKDGAMFWVCADAAIAALKPGATKAERDSVLASISGGNVNQFPTINTDFDDGKFQYNCQLMRYAGGCALSVQSNQP